MNKLRYAKSKPKKNLRYFLPAIIALVLILIGSGAILAGTAINRTGHITRPISLQQPNVTPVDAQQINFSNNQESGTVVYTLTQQGGVAYTSVVVTPTSTTGMTISTDKTGFSMAINASTTVTLTITFTDSALTSGDYSVDFYAT